jgi:site-specific DNA-cytosine methylase|tara:strand:- start:4574 stop:5764 length:1191 start_codon:yes stop_codon:yes gene_type:complete
MKYASIVPLIGGETIAMENVFGKRPEYILSYSAFASNDSQILNHYNNEVPYHVIDEGNGKTDYVDVVNTVCPCAGLSSLSPQASSTSAMNEWMFESAEYVLGKIKPKVFWGENAPRLASKMGEPVVKRLRAIGEANGYVFSIYRTKSILHGLSQVRDRTFYFFWKSDRVPLLGYVRNDHIRIEDHIRSVKRREDDPMNVLTNEKIPSENPYYRYVLEVIEGGITHSAFQDKIEKTTNPMDEIEKHTNYKVVAEWMREQGYENEASKCDRKYHKLKAGGNIMRKTTEIPKDYIGAFVGHFPTNLCHPDEDRYLTVREAMSIMKLPEDFELLSPKANLNHICQNVPVTTAEYPAQMIKKWIEQENSLESIETKFLVEDNKKRTYDYENKGVQLDRFML